MATSAINNGLNHTNYLYCPSHFILLSLNYSITVYILLYILLYILQHCCSIYRQDLLLHLQLHYSPIRPRTYSYIRPILHYTTLYAILGYSSPLKPPHRHGSVSRCVQACPLRPYSTLLPPVRMTRTYRGPRERGDILANHSSRAPDLPTAQFIRSRPMQS